jgi:starvation-inducible DNA-binding protein
MARLCREKRRQKQRERTGLRGSPPTPDDKVRLSSVNGLNQTLADTTTSRDLYKKHHWQVSDPTFYQLHLLFDKHYGEQAELVDALAERVRPLAELR